MGMKEKLASAKETNWISEGLSEATVKTIVELAKISARIERCRIEMGMTQKEFAEFMGVSQGMVSKWESREYNFTIRTLNDICQKIDLDFTVILDKPCVESNYEVIKWDKEKVDKCKRKNNRKIYLYNEEAIA